MGGSIAAAGHASAGCVAGGSAGMARAGTRRRQARVGARQRACLARTCTCQGPWSWTAVAVGGAAGDGPSQAVRRRAPSAGQAALRQARQGARLRPAVAGALLRAASARACPLAQLCSALAGLLLLAAVPGRPRRVGVQVPVLQSLNG